VFVSFYEEFEFVWFCKESKFAGLYGELCDDDKIRILTKTINTEKIITPFLKDIFSHFEID